MNKAAVIGAGIGGIATAIRLAAQGYAVDVWEANSLPGGKISERYWQGFRWDTGPSLFTLPELVDELFTLCGKSPEAFFHYHRLPLVCRYFYDDGTLINAYSDAQAFADEIAAKTTDSAAAILRYLGKSRDKYELTKEVFLHRSLHRPGTYVSWPALKAYPQMYKLDAFKSLHRTNVLHFRDERTVQLFDRFATYNGSDPYRAPATLSIIPHLEHNLGAWYPEGGMYSIVRALVKLAEEMGVAFHFNTRVDEIITAGNQAKGISAGGHAREYDIVVSNADVWATYRKLLPGQPAPEKTLLRERSCSALIFYWAMDGEFPELDLHNVFFSKNYLKEFYSLFREKQLYADPTVYVYISKKQNPVDAPQGKENWFVMINVPPNTGQDWDALIPEARQNILRKLEARLGMALSHRILHEEILDPRGIEAQTSSWQGALYGSASNDRFAAFLRHPNFHSAIKGLYFCGGSVHPGGGIPLCLLSARIVAEEVKRVK